MNKTAFVGLVFVLSFGVVWAGGKDPASGGCSRAGAKQVFQKAPDFNLPVWGGGGKILTLSEVSKDRPVLLVFWATWCPTCVSEVRTLNQWQKRYGPLGLKILAVSVQESGEKLQRFSEKHTLTYACLLDKSGDVAERYGVDSIPTAVLLAKGGEILYYGYQLPQDVERLLPVKS